MPKQTRGRGWHGDSAGHAKAGRKGGLARAQNSQQGGGQNTDQPKEDDME